MAKTPGCKRAPLINGELSQLYLDLFQMLKDTYKLESSVARQLTNVLYVHYEFDNQLKNSLDNQNKQRNSQDQHSAQDVFDVLHGDELVKYTSLDALTDLSIAEGAMTDRVNSTQFDTWESAYSVAVNINNAHRQSVSAYVIKNGDKYEVKVKQLNTSNELSRLNTQIEWEAMSMIKAAFDQQGLSLDNIAYAQEQFFGNKYNNLIGWLYNTPKTQPKHLMKEDIKMLISLSKDIPIIDRLITKFNDIETLANAYYDWYRENYRATPTTETQLTQGMSELLTLKGLDVDALKAAVDTRKNDIIQNSDEQQVIKLYEELHNKFKIGLKTAEVSLENLSSISKTLEAAIKVLGNRIKYIQQQEGKTSKYYSLLEKVSQLNNILTQKENSLGTINFLSEVSSHVQEMLNYFAQDIPQDTDLSYWLERGDHIREAQLVLDMYRPIISNMDAIDTLVKDINLTQSDANTISAEAHRVNRNITNVIDAIQVAKATWLRTTMELIMPENSPMSVDGVLATLKKDASIFDSMYNIATISHAPTAIIGSFMQKTYDARSVELARYQQRLAAISELVNHDTEFMYEFIDGQWYIKSDIDWSHYNTARSKFYGRQVKGGKTGYDLEVAMDWWERNNTEEIEVYAEYDDQGNKINSRTERIPKRSKYKKMRQEAGVMHEYDPLQELTPTQRRVYDEMMAIKGELETKFPAYAQNYYRPPQLRKSAADKLFSGQFKESIKEKIAQRFRLREDTQGYGQLNLDEDVESVRTDITGTSTNVIPIWYIHPLREQGDLFRNMTAGLLHLASSAVNYESMSKIQDSVELFDQMINSVDVSRGGETRASTYTYDDTTYATPLKAANRRSAKILDTYKRRLMYNNDITSDSISMRMFANTLSEATSVAALTFNVFGAINNRLEGIQQGLIESLVRGSKSMDLGDFMWGWSVMWGNNVLSVLPGDAQTKDGKYACGSFWKDLFSGRPSTIYGLLIQRLDPKKDSFDKILGTQYRKNFVRRIFSSLDLKFIMYSAGEELNNIPIVLGMSRHIEVLKDGKKVNLTSVLTRVKNQDSTYSLGVQSGVTDLNGNAIDEKFWDKLSARVGEVSEDLNGGMSKQVQGEIASTILGAALLKLRQWMIGVGSRNFRWSHINWRTGRKKTGSIPGIFNVTVMPTLKAVQSAITEYKEATIGTPWDSRLSGALREFTRMIAYNYRYMSDANKEAACRFLTTTSFITILGWLVDMMLLHGYKSHKDDEDYKIMFYLLKRRYKDSQFHGSPDLRHLIRWGQTASTLVDLTQKPYAHANIIGDILYPVTNMEDYGQPIERGVNKDKDRYITNWSRKWAPPLKLYDKLRGIEDTNDLLNSLGNLNGSYSMKKEYERLTGEEVKDKKKRRRKKI